MLEFPTHFNNTSTHASAYADERRKLSLRSRSVVGAYRQGSSGITPPVQHIGYFVRGNNRLTIAARHLRPNTSRGVASRSGLVISDE